LLHLWVVVVGLYIVAWTIAVVVPRVHHLRNVVIFIYLYLSDEVVDKVLKQSHDSHQELTSMQQNIHTT
jgi:uncharacterized protein YutE (UPF0331/DUF86 family)